MNQNQSGSSRVVRKSVLGPLLLLIIISVIGEKIKSKILIFANETKLIQLKNNGKKFNYNLQILIDLYSLISLA